MLRNSGTAGSKAKTNLRSALQSLLLLIQPHYGLTGFSDVDPQVIRRDVVCGGAGRCGCSCQVPNALQLGSVARVAEVKIR